MEEVAEPFLVRSGLLARTPRGRVATPAAWRHLGLAGPAAARYRSPPTAPCSTEYGDGSGVATAELTERAVTLAASAPTACRGHVLFRDKSVSLYSWVS